MNSFKIIHAFRLQSVDQLMAPNTIYAPKSEDEVTELQKFAEHGACEEVKPVTPAEAAKKAPAADAGDDITAVPGMNKTILAALAPLGVTTKTSLKDKIEDAQVVEACGKNYEKIAKYFTDSPHSLMNVDYGENAIDYTITMANANAEYSQLLPEGWKAIEIQCRDATDVRTSFVAGKVATPTDPYRTIKSGTVYKQDKLYINATTLYVACGSSGKIVEVRVWQ